MITLLRFLSVLVASSAPAFAHPGHLTGLAGHDHWVAGAAIGLAIALGLYGALKGKTAKPETDETASEEEDETEARA